MSIPLHRREVKRRGGQGAFHVGGKLTEAAGVNEYGNG